MEPGRVVSVGRVRLSQSHDTALDKETNWDCMSHCKMELLLTMGGKNNNR